MTPRFEITGLKEIAKRINRLDDRLQRRVYTKSIKAGGKILVEEAKRRAPRGATGNLLASIVSRSSSKPSRGMFGVKITVKGGLGSGSDRPDRYYVFQELGTIHHPAQPFLLPAITSKGKEAIEAVKREMADGLKRETATL